MLLITGVHANHMTVTWYIAHYITAIGHTHRLFLNTPNVHTPPHMYKVQDDTYNQVLYIEYNHRT